MIEDCGKRNMSVTPLRIRTLQFSVDRATRQGLTMAAVTFSVLILFISLFTRPWNSFLQTFAVALGLPALAYLGLVFLQFVERRLRKWPYWVECGERFTYLNLEGVHVLDWSDVKTIQFEYEHIYQGDDPLPHDGYNTHLIITLFPKKKLRLFIQTVRPCAAEYAERIVQTLVQGLRTDDIHTRRFAAEGLGRLGPEGVAYFRKTAKAAEHENIRKDATEALHKIEEAVPLLQEAGESEDEVLRKAAAEALARIQS